MTEEEIEIAARAIREVFSRRIYAETKFTPTTWEALKPFEHDAYREEARAAFDAVEAYRKEHQ